jgi:enterochelin esterase-like enzyme
MNYINPPIKSSKNVTHTTFYSQILNHDIGYSIYLPPDYAESGKNYSVAYHIHGWQGNESSDIWAMKKAYKSRQAITVFINAVSSENDYLDAIQQIESIIIKELIPHIDGNYRSNAARENRSISGFSMGGAMAFYYAVKHFDIFASVTAYAGTYHHFYYSDYSGVGEPIEKAAEMYKNMMSDDKCFDKYNILNLRENADKLRENLQITLQTGTVDPLICDNEIFHLYLNSLNIPHDYNKINGVAHELDKII